MSTKYLRIASDLHLEQFYGQDLRKVEALTLEPHEKDAESILVLAGDISSKPGQLGLFLKLIENRFRHVIYVPGNHEYYRHDMTEWNERLEQMSKHYERVTAALGKVKCVIVDDVRFIVGTMWSDGGHSEKDNMNVATGLWDFVIIRKDGDMFSVADMKKLHYEMVADIESFLKARDDKMTVVVTHHLPSYSLCHPRFGGSIDGGFASKSDYLLTADFAPDLWIHGHTHDTISRKLHNTQIVCNPRGYLCEVNACEHNSYAPLFVDVKNG